MNFCIAQNLGRQKLKELVDSHADSFNLEFDSIRQHNLKCELNKENIEKRFVCLECYKANCLQLTTVGSASDTSRAKSATDSQSTEMKHLHVSLDKSSYH